MGFKNCWTIGSSYDFQWHLQCCQRICCFSQTALLWFEVLPDLLLVPLGFSPTLPHASRSVVGALCYSECWQECPPRVWYSPEIDTSKVTLYILSDTSGGFQRVKYILQINYWCLHVGYFQNWAVTVLLSILPIKTANMLIMHNSDKMTLKLPYLQHQNSLMLFWHLFFM
jgi:hypothetical protein